MADQRERIEAGAPPSSSDSSTTNEDPITDTNDRSRHAQNEDDLIDKIAKAEEGGDGDAIDAIDAIDANDAGKKTALDAVKSHATDASLATTLSRTITGQGAAIPPQKPWYRQPNPLRWGSIPPVPTTREVSREHGASFLSRLTFQWMSPLMTTGYRRPLEEKDLWTVSPTRSVEPLTIRLKEAFSRRVANGVENPLWWSLHETFLWEFWTAGVLALISIVFQVLSPFTLRYLIQFATDAWNARNSGEEPPAIGIGIGLVLGVSGMQIIQSLGTNHFLYRSMTVGGQVRGTLVGMLFEKAMVLSGRARAGGKREEDQADNKEEDDKKSKKDKKKDAKKDAKKKANATGDDGYSNGRIVNMMSVDAGRIDLASGLFHMIWAGPLSAIITLALLIVNLGYSALSGFALLVFGFPLLTRAIRSLFARRRAINTITDQRVSLTQEILSAVRFVKFFAWETAFLDRLQALRDSEIGGIQVLMAIRNAILAVSMSMPVLAAVLAFVTYSLTNHSMKEPAKVFSSLALFNSLRIPLNLLPTVLGQAVDAWSSMNRIQDFLMAEEQSEDVIKREGGDGKNAMELREASFTWEKSPTEQKEGKDDKGKKKKNTKEAKDNKDKGKDASDKEKPKDDTLREPFKLQDLNLDLGRNELVAVIGGVGSGKSSLLAALAGDMRKTSGEVVLAAPSRAFCPQYAWIQNTTVRENILFGKDMDRKWYQQVVEACALEADLDMLPSGDLTEIGERGITISGGQKQRLNIARAIYFSADVVLMDDPLSAVDAHVGRHIFDKAILGLLGNKCRVLATHQLWVLHRCDRVVWMDGGRVRAVDTFDNLMATDESFRQLLETTATETEEKKKPKDGEDDDEDSEEDDDTKKVADKKKEVAKKKRQKAAALMQAEERAVSSVPWSVYAAYVRASGSLLNLPLLVFLLVLSQGVNLASSIWLSAWTGDRWGLSQGVYIGGYAALGAGQAIVMFAFSVALSILGTRASKVLLRQAVWRVLRAPMSFFDTTPLGRITNRFSRDVDVMDNTLPESVRMFSTTLVMILSVFVLVIVYYYYFAAALVPLAFIFVFASSYYRASAREVKRFEAVLRSAVFARFSEGLTGVPSIRAYGLQDLFIAKIRASVDEMNGAYFLTFSNQRWLASRLDLVGNLLVFTTGILVVTARFSVAPSVAGLVLSYIVSIVQFIQFSVRQLAEVENGMNSVERLQHYGTKLDEEAPLKTSVPPPDTTSSWPAKGEIVFDDVQMRYRPGLPLVLRGLSMHVNAGERVGIVGRTGAGKSSIVTALFRLSELSGGSITIDGLNIADVGLHGLRAGLAIIPQDPTLFRGTVRSNLDPFGQHTDLDLWSALRRADLVHDGVDDQSPTSSSDTDPATPSSPTAAVSTAPRITLDTTVSEDGLNFSLGQRQLMALARALVRDARVIICDEATSSVDVDTDDRIQATIASQFAGRTLLCIAHRLRTIVGYDRICVMDRGAIAELGSPAELWAKGEGGLFRGMCERGGIRAEDIPGVVA